MRKLASHTSALSSLKHNSKPKLQVLRAKKKEREVKENQDTTLDEEYKLDIMKLD